MHKWYIEQYLIPKFVRIYLIMINLIYFSVLIAGAIGLDSFSLKNHPAFLSGLTAVLTLNILLFVSKTRLRRQLTFLNALLIILWIFYRIFDHYPSLLLFVINILIFLYILLYHNQLYNWEDQLWLIDGEKNFRTFYDSILTLKRDDISLLRYFPFAIEPVILLQEYEQTQGHLKGYLIFTIFQFGIITFIGFSNILLNYYGALLLILFLLLLDLFAIIQYLRKAFH